MHPLQTLEFMAPATTLTLVGGSLLKELPEMRAKRAHTIIAAHPLPFIGLACLGVCVNVLGILIVKLTSGTMLKVLMAVRGPIVVLAGVLLFGEVVTPLELGGECRESKGMPE